MMGDSEAKRAAESGRRYHLMLFIAGDEPNSRLAKRNLAELCDKELLGQCRLEVVDVLEDFETAAKYHILLTPTLIRIEPEPIVTVIGNLKDRDKVISALCPK